MLIMPPRSYPFPNARSQPHLPPATRLHPPPHRRFSYPSPRSSTTNVPSVTQSQQDIDSDTHATHKQTGFYLPRCALPPSRPCLAPVDSEEQLDFFWRIYTRVLSINHTDTDEDCVWWLPHLCCRTAKLFIANLKSLTKIRRIIRDKLSKFSFYFSVYFYSRCKRNVTHTCELIEW